VHFLQIWIIPNETGLKPGYEQRSFELQGKNGNWILVAAPDARDGTVKVHQDVELSLALLPKGEQINYSLKAGRHAWLQVTRGAVTFNGTSLNAGDGASVSEEKVLEIRAVEAAELLLFDLA
jgi:redox-sensitive bicupin YhaK (pirin superfamily)